MLRGGVLSIEYFFLLVCFFSLLFAFLFKEREFDFVSVYIICLILFNTTTVFGIVSDPYTKTFNTPHAGTYVVTGVIFLVTIPFLFTKKISYHKTKLSYCSFQKENLHLFLIFMFNFLALAITAPLLLQASDKVSALESSNNVIITTAYNTLPVLGFILSMKTKNKKYIIYFLCVVLTVFLLGSRRASALILISYLLIALEGVRFSPIIKWKVMLVGMTGILLIILGKTYYGYFLKYGLSGTGIWLSNFNYEYLLTGNELLGRSSILNAVIEKNFSIDKMENFKSFLAIQPIPLSYFSFSSSYFNDEFQGVLFPGINYGMAYNPWAEAYSWGGILGVIMYSFLIPYTLYMLWIYYKKSSLGLSSIIMLLAVIISFWVHRNSLATELAYVRNALYPCLFIFFLCNILYRLKRLNK